MRAFWRLRGYLKPYRWHMLAVIVATVGVTTLNLAGPWILREFLHYIQVQRIVEGGLLSLFDDVSSGDMIRHLGVFTLLYAGAYVFRGIFQFMTSYLAHVTAWRYVSDLRVALYHHLQKLSLRFYQDKQTGEVMSRVVNDTNHIEPLVAHNIPDLIVNSLMIVGIAAILFYLFPSLALLTLLPVPLLVIAVLAFSGRTGAPLWTPRPSSPISTRSCKTTSQGSKRSRSLPAKSTKDKGCGAAPSDTPLTFCTPLKSWRSTTRRSSFWARRAPF